MSGKLIASAEPLKASGERARMRLLTCVRSHMPRLVLKAVESLVTHGTLEWPATWILLLILYSGRHLVAFLPPTVILFSRLLDGRTEQKNDFCALQTAASWSTLSLAHCFSLLRACYLVPLDAFLCRLCFCSQTPLLYGSRVQTGVVLCNLLRSGSGVNAFPCSGRRLGVLLVCSLARVRAADASYVRCCYSRCAVDRSLSLLSAAVRLVGIRVYIWHKQNNRIHCKPLLWIFTASGCLAAIRCLSDR